MSDKVCAAKSPGNHPPGIGTSGSGRCLLPITLRDWSQPPRHAKPQTISNIVPSIYNNTMIRHHRCRIDRQLWNKNKQITLLLRKNSRGWLTHDSSRAQPLSVSRVAYMVVSVKKTRPPSRLYPSNLRYTGSCFPSRGNYVCGPPPAFTQSMCNWYRAYGCERVANDRRWTYLSGFGRNDDGHDHHWRLRFRNIIRRVKWRRFSCVFRPPRVFSQRQMICVDRRKWSAPPPKRTRLPAMCEKRSAMKYFEQQSVAPETIIILIRFWTNNITFLLTCCT